MQMCSINHFWCLCFIGRQKGDFQLDISCHSRTNWRNCRSWFQDTSFFSKGWFHGSSVWWRKRYGCFAFIDVYIVFFTCIYDAIIFWTKHTSLIKSKFQKTTSCQNPSTLSQFYPLIKKSIHPKSWFTLTIYNISMSWWILIFLSVLKRSFFSQ